MHTFILTYKLNNLVKEVFTFKTSLDNVHHVWKIQRSRFKHLKYDLTVKHTKTY